MSLRAALILLSQWCEFVMLSVCSEEFFILPTVFIFFIFLFQEPIKSRAPQLHLEYRFYKQLGNSGKHNDDRFSVLLCFYSQL